MTFLIYFIGFLFYIFLANTICTLMHILISDYIIKTENNYKKELDDLSKL